MKNVTLDIRHASQHGKALRISSWDDDNVNYDENKDYNDDDLEYFTVTCRLEVLLADKTPIH